MRILLPTLLLIGLLALEFTLGSGCATILPPEGGARDTIPPTLDTMGSTPLFQTNFRPEVIYLRFQEFIVLKDAFNQVVTSPLIENYEVEVEKYKIVKFSLDPEKPLRENATYTINFGTAIQDFTEGNPTDFRFVFSTGPYLDSLTVRGNVVDAVSKEPVPEAVVMLYDNLIDSVVYKERPFYFARTDKEGRFRIDNIKEDTFKLFIIKEEGVVDYLYNQPSEGIGYLDEPFYLSDTTQPNLQLTFFQPELPLDLLSSDLKSFGKVDLIYNRPPHQINFETPFPPENLFQETAGDTIRLWYHQPDTVAWTLIAQAEDQLDTLDIPKVKPTPRQQKLRFGGATAKSQNVTINPFEHLLLDFDRPIRSVDTSLIRIFPDTLETWIQIRPEFDSSQQRQLRIRHKWNDNGEYRLQLLPGAITDIYGFTHDTLRRKLFAKERTAFGSHQFTLTGLDSTLAYIVEFRQGDTPLETFQVVQDTSFTRQVRALSPGKYQLYIVEDRNGNGRWDTGSYTEKRKPERIFTHPLQEVRANWDVEEEVNLNQ
jgi:hypothetical protein